MIEPGFADEEGKIVPEEPKPYEGGGWKRDSSEVDNTYVVPEEVKDAAIDLAFGQKLTVALMGLYESIYYLPKEEVGPFFKTLPPSVVRAYARVQEVMLRD